MLTVEPTHRITAKEALLHPFIETSDTESEKTAKRKVKVRDAYPFKKYNL